MTRKHMVRQGPLPEDMRALLRDYPREAWPDNPNFAAQVQHWIAAHQMFRQLARVTRKETERFLDKARAPDDYAGRLSYYGNALVRNLHGHHHWEDSTLFPELSRADARFDAGIDVLESDHVALDAVLDEITHSANRAIKLIHLDDAQARDEAGRVHDAAQTVEAFLDRHLADEEDLVVPIILHHKLRG